MQIVPFQQCIIKTMTKPFEKSIRKLNHYETCLFSTNGLNTEKSKEYLAM